MASILHEPRDMGRGQFGTKEDEEEEEGGGDDGGMNKMIERQESNREDRRG